MAQEFAQFWFPLIFNNSLKISSRQIFHRLKAAPAQQHICAAVGRCQFYFFEQTFHGGFILFNIGEHKF